MDKKHWDILGFWALGLIVLIATMIIIRWVIEFVTWSTIDSGWAQAIGGIAAIGASFGFFYAQKRAELTRAAADSVRAQTNAVVAVLSLCQRSITAMQTALEQVEGQFSPGILPFGVDRFDELRNLFCQFVDPAANFMSLQTALIFTDFLMEAKHDFAASNDEILRDYIIERSHARVVEAEKLTEILSGHQGELLNACMRYGINPIAGPLLAVPPNDDVF